MLLCKARQMGAHAAHSMAGVAEETGSGFTFELFAHVTRFVGKKVVLLGQYNGQGLEHEPEADMVTYSRITMVVPSLLMYKNHSARIDAPMLPLTKEAMLPMPVSKDMRIDAA